MSKPTPSSPTNEPWEALQSLVERGDADAVREFVAELPSSETAYVVSRLDDHVRSRLLELLGPDDAADLVEQLPEAQAAGLIEDLAPGQAADIVEELPSDEKADLLGQIPEEDAEAILAAMEPADARSLRKLRKYADDVAGGLMVTEYLAFPRDWTVSEVVDNLRLHADQYRDYEVQYLYVTQADGTLVGLIRPRDLLLARGAQRLSDIMINEPLTLRDNAGLADLEAFFDRHQFLGAPVVDASNRLVGVVQRSDVEAALAGRGDSDYRKSQGIIGGEELRSMPILTRSGRRLAWLSVNVLLNLAAASVIAVFQNTLAAVIALAVFLPIISDMSGCTGNQAVAVSMRELALGFVRPNDVLRVWAKELAVGVINGVALALLIGAAAWIWKGNWALGAVVGVAMALNSLIAVSIGGTVPLILKRMNVDPALASGPILTTITDMCGFFLVLWFATLALPWLT